MPRSLDEVEAAKRAVFAARHDTARAKQAAEDIDVRNEARNRGLPQEDSGSGRYALLAWGLRRVARRSAFAGRLASLASRALPSRGGGRLAGGRFEAALQRVLRHLPPQDVPEPPFAIPPPTTPEVRADRARSRALHTSATSSGDRDPSSITALVVHEGAPAGLRAALERIAGPGGTTRLEIFVIARPEDVDPTTLVGSGARLLARETEEPAQRALLRGMHEARGEHLVFLFDGAKPEFETLERLSELLGDASIGAVGPSLRAPSSSRSRHGGWKFDLVSDGWRWAAHPNIELGEPANRGIEDVPALGPGCLMVRRADFERLSGFLPTLSLEASHLDLCLRARRDLELRSVVAHELVVDVSRAPAASWPSSEAARFSQRHGWMLRRLRAKDLAEAARFLRDRAPRVGLVSRDETLVTALRARWWGDVVALSLSEDPHDLSGIDTLVCDDPDFDIRSVHHARPDLLTVAWVRAELPTWEGRAVLCEYEQVLSSSTADARRLRAAHSRSAPVVESDGIGAVTDALSLALAKIQKDSLRISIKVAASNHEVKTTWGDWHFALALRRCFWLRGHSVRVDVLCDWDTPRAVADDVVLVLRGLSPYRPREDQVNLMWNISHPEKVTDAEYEAYDHVFVASASHARTLDARLEVPVTALLQCTDPGLFFPEPNEDVPAHEVLFIGNSRRQFRPAVMDAIEARLPLSVYGGQWRDLIEAQYVHGSHIPNEEVRKYYSNAAILLNDHWPTMRDIGFLSNRLFDAAACGATIISDPAAGIAELFGESVRTYGRVEELRALVDSVLSDPGAARARALELAEVVRREHSFAARSDAILNVVAALVEARRSGPIPRAPEP